MQRTTDNITEVGRTAWTTARHTTNRALETPRTLLNAFGGRKAPYRLPSMPDEEAWSQNGDGDSHGDSEGLRRALLQDDKRSQQS